MFHFILYKVLAVWNVCVLLCFCYKVPKQTSFIRIQKLTLVRKLFLNYVLQWIGNLAIIVICWERILPWGLFLLESLLVMYGFQGTYPLHRGSQVNWHNLFMMPSCYPSNIWRLCSDVPPFICVVGNRCLLFFPLIHLARGLSLLYLKGLYLKHCASSF